MKKIGEMVTERRKFRRSNKGVRRRRQPKNILKIQMHIVSKKCESHVGIQGAMETVAMK